MPACLEAGYTEREMAREDIIAAAETLSHRFHRKRARERRRVRALALALVRHGVPRKKIARQLGFSVSALRHLIKGVVTTSPATGGGDLPIHEAAAILGRAGGQKGGPALAAKLRRKSVREERREICRAAARARWDRYYARHPESKRMFCVVPQCEGVMVARGVCRRHYTELSARQPLNPTRRATMAPSRARRGRRASAG